MKAIIILLFTLVLCSGYISNASAEETKYITASEITSKSKFARYDLNALNAEVNNLIRRVSSVKPSGNKDERRKQFFELMHELDRMDNKFDLLEDEAKSDLYAGTLTWDEYRKIDRKLDEFERKLNSTEEKLERRFGMDG